MHGHGIEEKKMATVKKLIDISTYIKFVTMDVAKTDREGNYIYNRTNKHIYKNILRKNKLT